MQPSELSVQGQSLQTLYNFYANKLLIVNRRYQRKLVWGVDEKEKLIDSIATSLPIPLILLAERRRGQPGKYEVIDGLQRLEAVFAFMDNKFSYEGEYFDLETIGDTKARLDTGAIEEQRFPRMSRERSLLIANYQLPVSIYRDASESAIDEVFRRINSGGRRLSLHEIRQAGAIGALPDLVRKTAAAIRGDGTFSDSIFLNDMAQLSISRKDLDYGLSMSDLFWARHDILGQEEIRWSSDEELILDLVLDCVVNPLPTTGWQNRDVAYGLERNIKSQALDEVNSLIQGANPDVLFQRIMSGIELIDGTMRGHGSLGRHMINLETYEKGTRRQFQAVFAGIYAIIYRDGLTALSSDALRDVLANFWARGVAIPTGGSAWGKDQKRETYAKVEKLLRRAFFKPEPHPGVVLLNSRKYVETLLRGPVSEDPMVELKQGFCELCNPPVENANLFQEVLQTCVAMMNNGPSSAGLVLVGVADKRSDADRIQALFGTEPIEVSGRHVVGTEAQLHHLGYDIDRWWRRWKDVILNADAPREFLHSLAQSLTPVYCDGLLLWELKPKSIGRPIVLNGKFYVRIGTSTHEIDSNEFMTVVMQRFA